MTRQILRIIADAHVIFFLTIITLKKFGIIFYPGLLIAKTTYIFSCCLGTPTFQPININYGLIQSLDDRIKSKKNDARLFPIE